MSLHAHTPSSTSRANGRPLAHALSMLACVAAFGCGATTPHATNPTAPATSQAAPPREAPGYRDAKAIGFRAPLPLAELFVPEGFRASDDGIVPLCVHFQGGAKAAAENFMRSGQRGVLIADGERALSQQQGREVKFGAISISFFSAGYGAVRELLKDPTWFARIDTLVSADSMYATVVAPAVRAPRIEDCEGFVRFAQAAARGEKTFVVAYGMYPTDYASTSETAALLCASVAGKWTQCVTFTQRGVPIARESHVGSFHCYEFAEATAGIHVDLLYFVPEMFTRHAR